MFDLVIRNGTVIDGSGGAPQRADVGIRAGKIAAVGDLAAAEAPALDAAGLVVCPGFVDIHSHSDYTLLVDPRAQSSVAQGVTTELIGNCGHGGAPILDAEAAKSNIYGYDPAVPITWSSMAEYLARMEQAKPAVNVLTLVPNGMLRLAVMGFAERPAGPDELRQMIAYLEAGFEQGAWGYSTGLEYPAERAAGDAELTALCEITARHGGLYAPHVRNRDAHALEAIDEALSQARRAGVRTHIPHLVPRRAGPEDTALGALQRIDAALAEGIDISIDMHTRPFGLTNLHVALPPWAFEGGPDKLRQRLSDLATRRSFWERANMIKSYSVSGWENVKVLTSARRPELMGKSFAEIAAEAGTTPFEAVLDLLLAEADDPYYPLVLCKAHTEEQMLRTFQHPACMVGSDATALCPDGPLAKAVFHGAYTWAAWFIRRCVRETRTLTLQEAIKKLTSQPAERIGLRDRGLVRAGYWADLAIFDPERFADRGTVLEPNQLAVGMWHVLVNGVFEMRDGQFTTARAGRVLRR